MSLPTAPPEPPSPPRRVSRRAVLGGALGTLGGGRDRRGVGPQPLRARPRRGPEHLVDHGVERRRGGARDNGDEHRHQLSAATTASVEITKVQTGSGSDTVTYFVADVTVSDATIVRSAFANDQFGQNIIANTVDHRRRCRRGPRDQRRLLRLPRHRHRHPQRRGLTATPEPRQGLAFYTDGPIALYDETDHHRRTSWSTPASGTHCRSGPALVDDGAIVAGIDSVEVDTNFGNHSVQGNQPRTAVGMVDANHLAVRRGRRPQHRLQPRRHHDRARPDLRRPRRDRSPTTSTAAARRRWYFNGALVNNPLGNGRRARHQRHPLRRGLRRRR